MSTRKRIKSFSPNVSGGGGGPGSTPTIDYGDALSDMRVAASHFDTLQAAASVKDAQFRIHNNATDTFNINANAALQDARFRMHGNATDTFAISAGASLKDARFAMTNYAATVTQKNASKDSWIDDPAVCTSPQVNHDDSNLQVEGVVASKKTAYIGWDLSGLPSGVTINSASLILTLSSPPALNVTVNVFDITSGTEGWDETTITCLNKPTLNAAGPNFSVLTTDAIGTQYTVNLATLLSTISNRIGTSTTFTLGLRITGVADPNVQFYSRDTLLVAEANKPKLTLTFTKTP